MLFKLIPVLTIFYAFSLPAQEPPLMTLLFDESDEIFPNPERGFYEYTYLASLTAISIRNDSKTLIYGKIVADAYREKDFDTNFLDRIQRGFDAARSAGAKVNVRVSYNDEIGQPDASKEQIFRHIDQLQPFFEKNKDVINLVEAGFIGSWGEWHSSTHGLDTPENRREILFKLLSALPRDRMVVIRAPHYKRQIFQDSVMTEERAFDGTYLARTGFHNDCFLSSANDVGTYIESSRSEEIAYISNETRYTPFGGETCALYNYSLCEHAIQEMEALHCSYLNNGWYPEVLDRWETLGCMEEIKRRLGYRFVLYAAEISQTVRPGGILTLNLEIENVGFAAPFNPRPVELLMRNADTGEIHTAVISAEPRTWLPGPTHELHKQFRIPYDWPEGSYDVLVRLPDPEVSLHDDPRYAIRFANLDIWEESIGGNMILENFSISQSATGATDPSATDFQEIKSSTDILMNSQVQPVTPGLKAFPNPFNGTQVIIFQLTEPDWLKVSVLNILGHSIRTLREGPFSQGDHEIRWNGRDNNGLTVSSGVYIIHFDGKHFSRELPVTFTK